MKPTLIAPLLSAVLPGSGLLYLGKVRRGIANLSAACAATFAAIMTGSEYTHYVLLAIAAGSAGYAHAIARADQHN